MLRARIAAVVAAVAVFSGVGLVGPALTEKVPAAKVVTAQEANAALPVFYIGAKPKVTPEVPFLNGRLGDARTTMTGRARTEVWAIVSGCVHKTHIRMQQKHNVSSPPHTPIYAWVDEPIGRGVPGTYRNQGVKFAEWGQYAQRGLGFRTLGRSWIWCDVDRDRQVESTDKFTVGAWVASPSSGRV